MPRNTDNPTPKQEFASDKDPRKGPSYASSNPLDYSRTNGQLDQGRHGDHFNDALDPAYNTLTNATFYGPGGQVLQNPGRDLSTRQDLNRQYPSWGEEKVPDRPFYSEGESLGLDGVNLVQYNGGQFSQNCTYVDVRIEESNRGVEDNSFNWHSNLGEGAAPITGRKPLAARDTEQDRIDRLNGRQSVVRENKSEDF